jgi:response regulator RpfG family c-di-GMP phosphodiesterase
LLIIDDNVDYGITLLEQISDGYPDQYHVDIVQTASAALQALKERGPYQVVLVDIKLPNENGIELTRQIIEKYPLIRVMLMSGHTDLVSMVKTLLFGAEKIFEKPLRIQQLIELIDNPRIKQRQSDMVPVELIRLKDLDETPFDIFLTFSFKKMVKVFAQGRSIESERIDKLIEKGQEYLFVPRDEYLSFHNYLYVPIHITMLVENTKIPFEIFDYQETRFSKVMARDGKLAGDFIQSHKSKGIKKLYIKDTDEEAFQHYLDDCLSTILEAPDRNVPEKAQALATFSRAKIQDALSDTNAYHIKSLGKVQKNLHHFIDDHSEGLGDLLHLPHEDDLIYQHSFNVATISYLLFLKIKEQIDAKNPQFSNLYIDGNESQNILFYGGLLHDIGEILLKKAFMALDNDNPQKTQLPDFFKDHVDAGVKEVSQINTLPAKVVEVIAQHEEYCDGSGLPNGLKKTQISLYGQIISLVNYYDGLVTKQGRSPADALTDIKANEKKFNKLFIPLLEEIAELTESTQSHDKLAS